MCDFASFVLTKDKEFYSKTSDSHEKIISEHGLYPDGTAGPNVVRVEITPDQNMKVWPSVATWKYCVDQDILPAWHDMNPSDTEKRARAALAQRVKRGFKVLDLSDLTKLTTLTLADRTKKIDLTYCKNLASVTAPGATGVFLQCVPSLKKLVAPKVNNLTANHTGLTRVSSQATNVNLDSNKHLEAIYLPNATCISVQRCSKLMKINAPKAKDIYISGTPKKIKIRAPKTAAIFSGGKQVTVKRPY